MCAAASKSRPAQRPAAPRWTPERCRGLSRIHGDARASPRPSGSGPTRRSRRARWTRAVERPRPRAGRAAHARRRRVDAIDAKDRARRDHAIEQPRPHGRRPLTATPAQAAPPPSRPRRHRDAHTNKMGRTTAADKKKMLLKIYHTKKEPFNLKELTKLAKAAGLAEKLVQDVNTQLMDDNYVSSDKIGTGNYFWAFPGSRVRRPRSSSTRSVARRHTRRRRRVAGVASMARGAPS